MPFKNIFTRKTLLLHEIGVPFLLKISSIHFGKDLFPRISSFWVLIMRMSDILYLSFISFLQNLFLILFHFVLNDFLQLLFGVPV